MKTEKTPPALRLIPLSLFLLVCTPGRSSGLDQETSPQDPLTAQEIIARAAENWGGMDRVRSIRTLRARFTYDEADGPVTHDIGRPSLVRSTGGERYVSVFDGEQAAFLRVVDRQGNPRTPARMPQDRVKDWELEKAWVFPAFFDHPAEYLGERELEGKRVHVLRVPLPLGARADYFLDAESFLVIRIEGMADMGGTTYHSGREYFDFQETDGVLYPTRMTYFYAGDPSDGTIGGLEINPVFPPDYFVIPPEIR